MDQGNYRVLARKYRPTTLSQMIGQDVLVRTLSNAINGNRVAHAFLLTGIRGVGKTTTARIIARALNCIGPDEKGNMTPEPCGVCVHCKSINDDRHVDVIEMDAASHTGVNDIRTLIDAVHYAPTSARFKVYIIDEVHMLSQNAFNALLKTLEEPPPHVKFIFATTETRKIPVTILSRCQRFDLCRVDVSLLKAHLADVAGKEAVTAEDEALSLVAAAAEGSVRDALSLFDQSISHSLTPGKPTHVQAETVRSMLGMADRSQLFALLESLFAGDVSKTLAEFQRLTAAGAEAIILLQDLLELTHFISSIQLNSQLANNVAYSETERNFAKQLAASLPMASLTRMWQLLLKGLSETRYAPNPQSATEMALIRSAYASGLPTPAEAIAAMGKRQEAKAPGEKPPIASSPVPHAPARPSLITTQPSAPRPVPMAQPAQEEQPALLSLNDVATLFEQRKEPMLFNYVTREMQLVSFRQGQIEINPSSSVPAEVPGKIGKLLTEWTGKRWVVTVSHIEGQPTIYSQQQAKAQRLKDEAGTHGAVADLLKTFPGAQITDVQSE